MSQATKKPGQPKVSRTFIYLVLGLVVVGAWQLAPPPSSGRKSSTVRIEGGTPRRATNDVFTPEDYTAKFARVTEVPKDVFRPLVIPVSAVNSLVALSPELVPTGLAGGEANWAYTGTAIIDGVPIALIENRQTLDGAFLKQGDGWKGAVVAEITPDTVTLVGSTGRSVTLRLPMPSYDEEGTLSGGVVPASPSAAQTPGSRGVPSGTRPLDPRLSGPIGQISISPGATQASTPPAPVATGEVR